MRYWATEYLQTKTATVLAEPSNKAEFKKLREEDRAFGNKVNTNVAAAQALRRYLPPGYVLPVDIPTMSDIRS